MKARATKRTSSVKIDPELRRQIAAVAASGDDVAAVFRLRPSGRGRVVPSPEGTETLVRSLLERVEKEAGVAPADFNVFRNLGAFVVSAKPSFIRRLLRQPEVASALANTSKASAGTRRR